VLCRTRKNALPILKARLLIPSNYVEPSGVIFGHIIVEIKSKSKPGHLPLKITLVTPVSQFPGESLVRPTLRTYLRFESSVRRHRNAVQLGVAAFSSAAATAETSTATKTLASLSPKLISVVPLP
jgi:hypothetical protein